MEASYSVHGPDYFSIRSFENAVEDAAATGAKVRVTLPDSYRMAVFRENMLDSGCAFKSTGPRTCVVKLK